jgi:helix-turn-helix protein
MLLPPLSQSVWPHLELHQCQGHSKPAATKMKRPFVKSLWLAERAGLSARYVGAIERGDVSASVTVLGQIAEALGTEPGDLLKRTGRATRS